MLDLVEIEGFKSIASAKVSLRSLNVLIGGNGSGKSNFIGVFSLLRTIVEQRLQQSVLTAGGADKWLRNGQKATSTLRLRVAFGSNAYQIALAPADDGGLVIVDENAWFDGAGFPPSTHHLANARRESQLREKAAQRVPSVASHTFEGMQQWRVFHFHDTSRSALVKQSGPVDDNVALRDDGSNLAAVLFRMQTTHPKEFQRVSSAVQQVAPFFERFILSPSRLNPNVIKLEWKERRSEAYLDGHALSDGTLRFMCLLAMVYQPDPPRVIVVDEPELGLHPYAISFVANLFRSVAAERRVQLIVATQSTAFVNQLEPTELIVVERDDDLASTFRRLEPEPLASWLESYALGDLWEKNLLGGRPK